MNKEKWDRLKNLLKNLDDSRFNMENWGHNNSEGCDVKTLSDLDLCGSTACVAGCCLYLKNPNTVLKGRNSTDILTEAANELGISERKAERLFEYGDDWDEDIVEDYGRTTAGAIAMMERMENE